MRAMILAAGRGERLRPLTTLRPKPALPVRGVPVVGYLLELLAASGVTEVVLNVHHLADAMRQAALAHCPKGLELHFSHEPQLLGTGGGIRRVASFLRDSDPSLVLAGDMLFDFDLDGFVARHRERGDAATLLLRSDPRSAQFGAIGLDAEGSVRRIGNDFDLGGSVAGGLFVGVRAFAARCFDSLPDRDDAFEDLRDWLAPRLSAGDRDIRGERHDESALGWEPVGTPAEYLAANLHFARRFDHGGLAHPLAPGDVVVGPGAVVPGSARLERTVVWDGERVPDALQARDGAFADGRFVALHAGNEASP